MIGDSSNRISNLDCDDPSTPELLLPLVYKELKDLAAAKIAREPSGQSLQPTLLVHEAYIRLVDVSDPQRWDGRAHFFAAAAEAMRRILIENARRKKSIKRGAGKRRIPLSSVSTAIETNHEDLLSIDDVLQQFEATFPDKAKVVKLRFFIGLTVPEISSALSISVSTVERHLRFARAWMFDQLEK